jgi:hypothetical protein
VVIAPGPSALARHLLTIAPSIVEQFFRNRSQPKFHRSSFHPSRIHFVKPSLPMDYPLKTRAHTLLGITIIDSLNLFIAFDYLPNWPQHPPHNELLYAFWLVRVLATVQSGDRSVKVAMRCHPSI